MRLMLHFQSKQPFISMLVLVILFLVGCTPTEPINQQNTPSPEQTPTEITGNQSSYPVIEATQVTLSGYPAPWTPASNTQTISSCVFTDLASTETTKPPLDKFIFSDPQVIFESSPEIQVIEWLPDSQRILLGLSYQTIGGQIHHIAETLNIATNETEIFVDESSPIWPLWVPQVGAVAYEMVKLHEQGNGFDRELWLSYGQLETSELITTNFIGNVITASNSQFVLFTSDNSEQLQKLDLISGQITTLSINPSKWQSQFFPNLQAFNSFFTLAGFQMDWHPQGEQVLIYQFPVVFLYNLKNEEVCEIYFGETSAGIISPLKAVWSPNGRYLALLTSAKHNTDSWGFVDMAILDLQTNTKLTVQPSPYKYVSDFVWSPDSQYLAVLGKVTEREISRSQDGLFIIEASTGKFQQGVPEQTFGYATLLNHAWSPDGTHLAILCPNPLLDEPIKLCLISLEVK